MSDHQRQLQHQIEYYRARAQEYDEWFERRVRYDMGPEHTARWTSEVDRLATALQRFAPSGRVIELAGRTGWWTRRLVEFADELWVVDSSIETLALNQQRCEQRVSERRIAFRPIQADLFNWESAERFDVVFFSFWLSHVPRQLDAQFWQLVQRLLKPHGRLFFIDSARSPESIPDEHRLPDEADDLAHRRLNDGSQYSVIKRFFEPHQLQCDLTNRGFSVVVRNSGSFFIYGHSV